MAVNISGQKTISAAGTAEALGSQLINGPLLIKALEANTNPVFIGAVNGDVASTNGIQLAAGDEIYFSHVGNLATIWVDVTTNDEGVAWLMLEV